MKAQDYKDIKTNNTDTLKVMANNEIWWEKFYFWEKFKLKPIYKTEEDLEITQEKASASDIYYLENINYFYPRVNFSKSRKEFEGDGGTQHKSYFAGRFGFAERNDVWYRVIFDYNGRISEAYKMGYIISYKNVFSHNSKGDFIEEVKSNNKDEYPTDGQSGNFWYVFKS